MECQGQASREARIKLRGKKKDITQWVKSFEKNPIGPKKGRNAELNYS